MRRVAGLFLFVAAVLSAETALADGAKGSATSRDDGADVHVLDLGEPGTPTRSSGGTISCQYIEVGEEMSPSGYGGYDGLVATFDVVDALIEDWWYVAACSRNGEHLFTQLFQYTPGDLPLDAELLAQEAVDSLVVAYPTPHLSPPAEFDQLVGFRTWLWIAPEGFEPVSASASIPGLSVSATATPTRVLWDMGDGSEPIACDDAGTAYDTDVADDVQETECYHVFQWAGDYTARVTTTWAIEWSATNGDGGSLASIDRTTSVDLHVVERQAVVIDNP